MTTVNGQTILSYNDDFTEPNETDIHEYAEFIGIDVRTESHLMWVAKKGVTEPLPEDWKPCKTPTGDVYFFNFNTGESIWDHPSDEYYKNLVLEEREKSSKSNSDTTTTSENAAETQS